MHPNEQLITNFYAAFQQQDYKTMQSCYADNAVFSDPVFKNLDAKQVRAMWEMFCTSGQKIKIEFKNVTANDGEGSAEWTAWYKFSRSGRNVENRIKASFVFENGKIVRHTDRFSFYRWAKQALGVTGLLLGWLPSVKDKVRMTAMQNLTQFISRKTVG